MGYFGLRAGPMGAAPSGVVEAVFGNFAPTFVRRWVPAVWELASPEALVAVRAAAAAASLRRLAPSIEAAISVDADLAGAIAAASAAGRPLFAANRDLAPPTDPVARLWQRCTTLREHRGDGHVAALTAAGLDGLDAHVLIALEPGGDAQDLQRTRGWSARQWALAVRRLQAGGLLDSAGRLSAAGRRLRDEVEATTDRLALTPWEQLDDGAARRVIDALSPAAEEIAASGLIRYPNPIGLPSLV
jgi:hypothetical protein